MDKIQELKKRFTGQIEAKEPMSLHTTLALGGPALAFTKARQEEDLVSAVKSAKVLGVKYMVIGDGSDLLISEKGFDGLVIKNEVYGIKEYGSRFIVKGGTSLQDLVDKTIEKGYLGMERMTGIPGTVGGAVYGNAGAYGQVISDNLVKVKAFDGKKIRWINKKEGQFSYRESIFKKNKWVLLATEFKFGLKAKPSELKKASQETLSTRLKKYKPGIKCPGSFFKNVLAEDLTKEQLAKIPKQKIDYGKIPAGYLLEEVGAKGKSLGKIVIADYHANLFINSGGGSASDFYKLANIYAAKVEAKFGIKLQPEVQLVGF